MGNLKLFIENNIVRADISGSTALANYPAVNVRHPSPSTVCRLDTGTEGYIDIDLSNQTTKRYASGIYIVNHNLTAAGSIAVQAGTSQGASDILDIEFDAHESIWGWGEFPWAEWVGWGGYMSPDMIREYFPYILRPHYFNGVAASHWRITFTEPEASGLDYIEIGVIGLSDVYQPTYNMAWGYQMTPMQLSKLTEMAGGNTVVDLGDKKRRFLFKFNRIKNEEIYWNNQKLAYIVGNTRPVFADIFPDDTNAAKRVNNRCYGYMRETPGIEFPSLSIVGNTGTFVIEDEL